MNFASRRPFAFITGLSVCLLLIYQIVLNLFYSNYSQNHNNGQNPLFKKRVNQVDQVLSLFLPKFNSSLACNIPLYVDPWDWSAKEYVKVEKVSCPKGRPITYVDTNGRLRKNASYSQLVCKYSFMKRKPMDQLNDYSPMKELTTSGVQLTSEKPFATTTCYEGKPDAQRPVYTNTHLRVPDFNVSKASPESPSVFILVLESLSRLGYLRFFKNTQKAMSTLGHLQILSGLTKVGPNSFPNSFAFLTGIPMLSEDCRHVKTWDNKYRFVWDDFKQSGYLTAFVEDMSQSGLFTYYNSGWIGQPTDWYPTPFWNNMYPKGKPQKGWKIWTDPKEYCYPAEGSKIDMFMKQLAEFREKMDKLRQTYFMYSFYSQSIHEDFDFYPNVDQPVANFIQTLKGQLNNTVLILMGDHGTMHGKFAEETVLGHLEASLPLFAIRVPESLHKRHPHLRQYLHLNRDRLLSWWDIREMILDIVNGTYHLNSRETLRDSLSPWRTLVPDERTCEDARIGQGWCVCNGILGRKSEKRGHYKNILSQVLPTIRDALSSLKCNIPPTKVPSIWEVRYLLPKDKLRIGLFEQISFKLGFSKKQVIGTQVIVVRERSKIRAKWSKWRVFFMDLNTIKDFC